MPTLMLLLDEPVAAEAPPRLRPAAAPLEVALAPATPAAPPEPEPVETLPPATWALALVEPATAALEFRKPKPLKLDDEEPLLEPATTPLTLVPLPKPVEADEPAAA